MSSTGGHDRLACFDSSCRAAEDEGTGTAAYGTREFASAESVPVPRRMIPRNTLRTTVARATVSVHERRLHATAAATAALVVPLTTRSFEGAGRLTRSSAFKYPV